MKATLAVINQMQAVGVIGRYAIGGAVGATFYLEPSATLDIDVPKSSPVMDCLPNGRSSARGSFGIYERLDAQSFG
jgi:hypothetical protein